MWRTKHNFDMLCENFSDKFDKVLIQDIVYGLYNVQLLYEEIG